MVQIRSKPSLLASCSTEKPNRRIALLTPASVSPLSSLDHLYVSESCLGLSISASHLEEVEPHRSLGPRSSSCTSI